MAGFYRHVYIHTHCLVYQLVNYDRMFVSMLIKEMAFCFGSYCVFYEF